MSTEADTCPFQHFETDDGFSYVHRRGRKVDWLDYGGGMWLVAGYQELVEALKDDATFSSQHDFPNGSGGRQGVMSPPTPIRAVPIEMDPPTYQAYRKLLAPFISPNVVRGMAPRIRSFVRWCLAHRSATGTADLFNDMIKLVPAMVTLELIGMPIEDAELIADAIHRRGDDRFSLSPTWALMFKRMYATIEDRRADPTDDLISYLLAARVDDEPLTEHQIVEICFTLIVGGMSTTAKLGLGALAYLGVNREARAEVIADPSRIPAAVEEFLRYYSPVSILARTATRDVCVAGQDIKAGDRVGLGFAAANRDPDAFGDPNEIDLERTPNRHVAFGHGVHFCIGSNLGRAEVTIMIEEVLALMPEYELDGEFYLVEDLSGDAGWGHLRKVSWGERLGRGLRVVFPPTEPPETDIDLEFTRLPAADDTLTRLMNQKKQDEESADAGRVGGGAR